MSPPPLHKQVFFTLYIAGERHNVSGRKRTPKGYIQLCIKSHPNSDVTGHIFEHRVMMEIELGRYLLPEEIVHHKNEVKHDNRIDNLVLMDRGEHTTIHHKGVKRDEIARRKMSIAAKERLLDKSSHPSYKRISKEELMRVLEMSKPTYAAKHFGVTRKTIYNKIAEFGLEEWYRNDKQNDSSRKIN